MKKIYKISSFLALFMLIYQLSFSQAVTYSDSWGKQGVTLQKQTPNNVNISYSIHEFSFEGLDIDGVQMTSLKLPGVFLPNDEGAPDLPGTSKYIAVPRGANVSVKIVSSRTEILKNQNIAPAPRIPLDTEQGPLHYAKNSDIYSADAFYPAEPVFISELSKMRGVDVVMLGITPFQYNPVTKELIVHRDMEIEITFEGGTGIYGEEKYRSRWWDPIMAKSILNADALPEMNYNKPKAPTDTPDYEYLIITPDDADFLAWADSIKTFRTLQGIYTGIVTLTEIGGNTVSAIETYVDNAYNSWSVPPSAVLLLGDYGTGSSGITSQIFSHPAGYPDFVSDNQFADVTGNNLPDIAFARITANNAAQLEVMITKFLDYERNPPTSADFYDHPITALGWQTERWFQICSEVVGGYLKNELGKNPVRINEVYSGNPTSDPWSTATNTSTVLNYFGPNGLGYIPATPQELGGFENGSAADVINAINDGSYMLQHRDHGYYGGWGEPSFTTTSINSLNNINNELPFIFSINCQTGAFHRTTESFAEKFHRHTYNGQNSGALGIIAATEVSYSFVNDVYVWGVFDNMHPDFMPGYSTTFPVNYAMPAFGNVAGKNFLYSSSWPYNTSDKLITYRLFHHHGDAFLTLYTEAPQALNVSHASILQNAATSFSVTADAGSMIALTLNGVILGTADGTGSQVSINIPQQNPGDVMVVTITKQNYYRYSSNVDVVSSGLYAQFSGTQTTLCSGGSVNFTDESYGLPTSWNWTFEGGTPGTYSGQYPPAIVYNTPGVYDVTLEVGDGSTTDSEVKTGYITIESITADFTGSPTTLVIGSTVSFTDNTSCNPTSWSWSFPGGTPSTSNAQNPVITYNSAGTYAVTLVAANASGNDTETKAAYIDVSEVPLNYCTSQGSNYSYEWIGKVDFDAFSNSSGASGYTDFTNLTVDMNAGANVNVTLTPAFSGTIYSEYWRIWIDYNRDGDFEDSGEEVFAPASTSTAVSGSFTVAAGASGKTRMRVTMKWNGIPTPCETFSYGEVEDYTVDFGTQLPPVADFSGSPTSILEGESVQFNDLSTNNPTSWSWTFNGGTPSGSSLQNPNITYSTAGTYTVSLTATNGAGSDAETKTNYITVNALPACAGLASPANGAVDVALNTDLDWNAATGATGYKIYFGTNNPPTNIENGTNLGNVTLYNPTGDLAYNTQYYWKVVAYNAFGDATGCSTWSFTTEEEVILPPGCATLASPANGVGDISIATDLDWISVAEATGYKIYFGTDNPPTNIENGTDLGNATLYNPPVDLAYLTTYYWKVVAYNPGGDATGCATWSFTTEEEVIMPPACAMIANPANGASDISIATDLDWNNVGDATGYKIFFGTDVAATNIENGNDLGNTTLYDPAGDLAWSTTYYWKVVAYNLGGDATGCSTWSFTTEDEPVLPPACATLDSPTDGATGILISDDLAWNSVIDATGYKLSFGTDYPPTNIANGIDLGDVTFYDPAGDMAYNTTYYWQVVANNQGGDATGCSTWSFTTEEEVILPPACATILAPGNGATATSIAGDLDWNSVADATGYKIYFGTDVSATNIENGTDLGNVTLYNPAGDLAWATTYYWKVVAYNLGGDATGCTTWSFTTEDQPTGPVELLFTDFESGFGPWTDGGGDCLLYTSGTYAAGGNNAGGIQDNSGVASSFYLTNGIDIHTPGYLQLNIEFDFIAVSMDNSNEDFWVQYFDGTSWFTVASYARTIDFENGIFYSKDVVVMEADYNFPTDMKIRFMCDASGNADDVYIDNIRITASAVLEAPNCATLVTPSNNETGVSIFTNLDWNSTATATGYLLYFGTDNPPTNIVNSADLGNATYFDPVVDLINNTTYYWKVVPYNDGGTASGCDVWAFTTEAETVAFDELSFSDFESGWGIWTDGGGDCELYTSSIYAPVGTNAADIQDNSGVASSFYLTNGVDVHNPGYAQINVEFEFIAISMDNTSEDFWVQYFDGSIWNTIATYARTTDFENNLHYAAKVNIFETDFTFPTDMKIRFMCDASANKDDVYIDQIRISAGTQLDPDTYLYVVPSDNLDFVGIEETADADYSIYPNPASSFINISAEVENSQVEIYNIYGKLVKQFAMKGELMTVDINDLESGMYILSIISQEGTFTQKVIKK